MKPILVVSLGLLAGIGATFFPQFLFVLALSALAVYILPRYFNDESKDFILKLLIYGLALRILLLLLHHFLGLVSFYYSGDTQPDGTIYNSNAAYVSHVLRGPGYLSRFMLEPFVRESVELSCKVNNGTLPAFGTYQYGAYVYSLGFFYAIFGYAPLAAKLVNSLLGCGSAIIVYLLAVKLTKSVRTAKASAVMTMFFPSMVLWSITMLQDTLVNFLFLLLSLFGLKYISGDRKNAYYALPVLVLLSLFKPKISVLFAAGFIAIVCIDILRLLSKTKLLTRFILLTSAGFGTALLLLSQRGVISKLTGNIIYSTLSMHKAAVTTYKSAASFKIYRDNLYNANLPLNLSNFFDFSTPFTALKGLSYYFLSPFPWYVPYAHPFLLIFYCQVVFTFICLPFMFMGICGLFRKNVLAMSGMTVFLFILIIPQAMCEGVIGTVARHRDMFMPFIFIFSCYGFYRKMFPVKERDQAI